MTKIGGNVVLDSTLADQRIAGAGEDIVPDNELAGELNGKGAALGIVHPVVLVNDVRAALIRMDSLTAVVSGGDMVDVVAAHGGARLNGE